MRKLALMAVLASTALATPALARDGAWYVGIEGGAMIVEDIDYDISAPVPVNNAFTVDHKYGYDVDAIIGYDFGAFRAEGEVGYKRAYYDIGDSGGLDGRSSALSFMVNALLDFGPDDGLSGYIGGGAGVARVRGKFERGVVTTTDTDTKFAWQAIAGVRAPLTSSIDVGLKYRFFNVSNYDLIDGANTIDGRFRSHSLLGSLVFNFGEPAAPPPPPPPPAVEVPGPFIVFFDWDRSDITPEAASILDNAAQAYATTGQASIMLAGHADKSGSDQYNVGLSQRRADAVKTYLAGKGVPDTSITTEAFGESRPLVETADGVREPQNRRVEITFGPGSGM